MFAQVGLAEAVRLLCQLAQRGSNNGSMKEKLCTVITVNCKGGSGLVEADQTGETAYNVV